MTTITLTAKQIEALASFGANAPAIETVVVHTYPLIGVRWVEREVGHYSHHIRLIAPNGTVFNIADEEDA